MSVGPQDGEGLLLLGVRAPGLSEAQEEELLGRPRRAGQAVDLVGLELLGESTEGQLRKETKDARKIGQHKHNT